MSEGAGGGPAGADSLDAIVQLPVGAAEIEMMKGGASSVAASVTIAPDTAVAARAKGRPADARPRAPAARGKAAAGAVEPADATAGTPAVPPADLAGMVAITPPVSVSGPPFQMGEKSTEAAAPSRAVTPPRAGVVTRLPARSDPGGEELTRSRAQAPLFAVDPAAARDDPSQPPASPSHAVPLAVAPLNLEPGARPREAHDIGRGATARPAEPAEQVGTALVAAAASLDGAHSVTVRLEPGELGSVHIRIDHTAAGAARVSIAAERPETLQLLRRDLPRLEAVLDRAGISPEGRGITFQTAPQLAAGSDGASQDAMGAGPGGGFGQGPGHGTGQGAGQRPGGDAWRQGQATSPGQDVDDRNPVSGRWMRAGLDITA